MILRTGFWKTAAVTSLMALVAGCATLRGEGDEVEGKVSLAPEASFTQIGVNAFLWRASLETLKFMPLADVDSNGGVLLTDWYVNPDVTSERLKVKVMVVDARLRADALKVDVFRQENQGGTWVDMPVRAGTGMKIEDAILMKARELKIVHSGE